MGTSAGNEDKVGFFHLCPRPRWESGPTETTGVNDHSAPKVTGAPECGWVSKRPRHGEGTGTDRVVSDRTRGEERAGFTRKEWAPSRVISVQVGKGI